MPCVAPNPARPQPPRRAEDRGRHLLARIQRRYQTHTQSVDLLGREFLFVRIADPNLVLDDLARAEDLRQRLGGDEKSAPAHMPYWAELWDAALGLGQWLLRHGLSSPSPGTPGQTNPHSPSPGTPGEGRGEGLPPVLASVQLPPAPRVLDLGCGMGLAGTVAAALGGRVLLADLEPAALLLARLNCLVYSRDVRARVIDWRSDRLDERFDLILGADILYERAQWVYQERFFRHHLAAGGRVLLGEPGRQSGQQFLPWIEKAGWKICQFAEPVETRSAPIRIFELVLL